MNFKYYDPTDGTYSTVTLHADGCYNGSTSWGVHVKATSTASWGLLGWSEPAPQPSFESSPNTGNTWWSVRPVYGIAGGFVLLLTPTTMLSKVGVWYAYDYTTKICTNGSEDLWKYPGEAWEPGGYWQLGSTDLSGGSTGTGDCANIPALQPIFQNLWFSSYTS